jgi:hypothetical protein
MDNENVRDLINHVVNDAGGVQRPIYRYDDDDDDDNQGDDHDDDLQVLLSSDSLLVNGRTTRPTRPANSNVAEIVTAVALYRRKRRQRVRAQARTRALIRSCRNFGGRVLGALMSQRLYLMATLLACVALGLSVASFVFSATDQTQRLSGSLAQLQSRWVGGLHFRGPGGHLRPLVKD